MSEVARVPQLRFPEFSNEWEKNKLGNLAVIKSGISPSKYELKTTGSLPFLKVEDLNNCRKYQFNSRVYSESLKNSINKNSVIFPKRGAAIRLNKVRINKVAALMDSNLMALLPNTELLNTEFLYYKIMLDGLYKIADTSTIPQINNKHILPYKLNLPILPEQQKIAAFLTAVDNKIEQLSKKQELLGEYKKGLMQQIFSQAIRFKADDGSDFPDWEEKKLGGIGHTFNGLTGKTKDDFGRGKPYIQYMQIFESSKINIDNFGLVDVRDDENQKVAQYGDVFFTTSSETPDAVGYSSVLLDDIDKLYLNSFCFGFRPNSLDELSPNFAQFLLRSANFRRRVVRLAQGSTRYNMSKVQLMKEVISLPCLKEQTKIANFLSSIDTKIEQVGKQLDESKQFKKALLQKMFV